MKVLSRFYNHNLLSIKNTTKHLSNERKERLKQYDLGYYLDAFIVDNNHQNGYEIHVIDSKGYILIFNLKSKRFITVLSGRPAQIKRYYNHIDTEVKKAIETAFKRNQEKKSNKK